MFTFPIFPIRLESLAGDARWHEEGPNQDREQNRVDDDEHLLPLREVPHDHVRLCTPSSICHSPPPPKFPGSARILGELREERSYAFQGGETRSPPTYRSATSCHEVRATFAVIP